MASGGVRVVSVAPLGAAQGKIHSGDILAAGNIRWLENGVGVDEIW